MSGAVHPWHQAQQVTLLVRRAGGGHRTCELWVVCVDEAVFLRALSGVRAWWYRQVSGADAQLWCEDGILDARFDPVDDPALLDRIDAAYEAKYGLGWPGPVGFITAAGARSATLRVVTAPGTGRAPAPEEGGPRR